MRILLFLLLPSRFAEAGGGLKKQVPAFRKKQAQRIARPAAPRRLLLWRQPSSEVPTTIFQQVS